MGKSMICPKCKKEIPEKTVKCEFCGARIATFCKKCRAYNSIYNLNCVSCNNELLKLCPACKSVNLPNSATCRKCNHVFVQQETKIEEIEQKVVQENPKEVEEAQEPINLNYDTELHAQSRAKELLIEGLTSLDKKIISLSGQQGVGKSIVLKSVMHELKEHEVTILFGECSAITQLSPCGFIQNLLLTFFNVANYCADSLKLKKESQRFFQNEFPGLTNEEIFNLLNLLYPTNQAYFEDILKNKEKTFIMLKKVFKTIIENNKTVFVIENFELIDGLSYEFLHNFINISNEEPLSKPFKILITYNEIRPARGYLYCDELKNNAYLDVALNTFDKNQMGSLIDQYFEGQECPSRVKEQLYRLSAGNPARLEQLVSLLIDFKTRNNSTSIEFPELFDVVIKMRLDFLKENPTAYRILAVGALQGINFYPAIINEIIKIDENEFIDVLNHLQQLNYIMPVNEFSYGFKNSMLWASIFESIKKDENFSRLNESLFNIYSNYTLSSNTILAIIAQNIEQNLSALNIWTDNIKLAAYIGDTNLYAISQKQCLTLIEKLENVDASLIKNNIFERLGKLLTSVNPKEAMEYLPAAILNAQKLENPLKEIELTGYLASCCIKLGDYYGTIECVDAAIEKLDYSFELERAILKSRKLDALLNIGNSGEIINIVDNDIMPVFDKYIVAKNQKTIPIQVLYKAWLQCHLTLINALIFQGNNRAFQVLSTLFEIFEKNHFDDKLFICKTKLALAFAHTIKGEIETSEEILGEIIRVYKTDIMDNEAISRWNLINILNNFIHKKYSGLQEELFQVVSFANNINDNFTKNILKTMLGKLLKDQENAKHALEIYSEQITYFAKEKNAIGALLTWYLIAEADLIVEGPNKSLEVAQKALEVAKSPKIHNYTFVILFNKVIAEALMAQSDYASAKVHIEKAILIARKFELLNFLADLYLLYGKYLQDIALVKSDAQMDYVTGAAKMYKKAFTIANAIKNNYLLTQIEKSKTVLNSFCQLNGIILKDS